LGEPEFTNFKQIIQEYQAIYQRLQRYITVPA